MDTSVASVEKVAWTAGFQGTFGQNARPATHHGSFFTTLGLNCFLLARAVLMFDAIPSHGCCPTLSRWSHLPPYLSDSSFLASSEGLVVHLPSSRRQLLIVCNLISKATATLPPPSLTQTPKFKSITPIANPAAAFYQVLPRNSQSCLCMYDSRTHSWEYKKRHPDDCQELQSGWYVADDDLFVLDTMRSGSRGGPFKPLYRAAASQGAMAGC